MLFECVFESQLNIIALNKKLKDSFKSVFEQITVSKTEFCQTSFYFWTILFVLYCCVFITLRTMRLCPPYSFWHFKGLSNFIRLKSSLSTCEEEIWPVQSLL